MKRREVLRFLPLSLAGIKLLAKDADPFFGPPSYSDLSPLKQKEVLATEVRTHNGTPTLFINGQPTFAGISWVAAPEKNQWNFAEQAKRNADAGIHIYAFDVGKGTEWVGPGTDLSHPFNFNTLEARFSRILEADPRGLFHLRIYLETGHNDWWEQAYPQECEVTSEGKRNGQSFASRVWREQAKEFLKAYVAQFERIGLADHVFAFQVGTGHTGEWVKGESSMSGPCGDYSEPMRRHFRSWVQQKYQDNPSALQKAWADPKVTFLNAEVPSAEAQLQARRYTFRDPAQEQNVIDYYECLAELCSDCLIDFCRTVKEAAGGPKLAGAFYGYLMELAWNGGFFKERPDSDYSTYQRSGHLGLGKVLRSPYVDFLVSPYGYGFRGIGGDGPSISAAAFVLSIAICKTALLVKLAEDRS